MIFVPRTRDLEFFNSNPDWECYGDIVTQPSDIILQVQLGTGYDLGITPILPVVNVCKADGTFIENGSAYFDMAILSLNLNGVTYFYANIIGNRYSPGMLANGCFVLNVIVPKTAGGVNYFNQWTQKYELLDPGVIPVSGVIVTQDGTGNLATLCGSEPFTNNCRKQLTQLVWQSDCIDSFTGDFYGTGTLIYSNTTNVLTFTKLSNIEAFIKTLPKNIKRTISINCRTQRTETTQKYQLQGTSSKVAFPEWKMLELEGMLLSNHFFIDGKEYQSEGGTAFEQLGTPKNCGIYRYKLAMDLQDCFEWQTFGCTPPCEPMIYYYPIAF